MNNDLDISRFPRAVLWDHPTPLEPLHNLAKSTNGGKIFVKRDDCNGLAFGGNKVRQLEYYLGEAIAQNADTVLMTGAVQSNFVRTAAAACCKLGLKCHIQLEDRVPKYDFEYNHSGNVLLNHLFGATVTKLGEGEDEAAADTELNRLALEYQNAGRSTYVVPMHESHPPLGALGYLRAAQELVSQMNELSVSPDRIFVGSGSGNTHAGLLIGLRLLGNQTPVIGVCVRRNADLQRKRMTERCRQLLEMMTSPDLLKADDLILDDTFLAPGYGQAGENAKEAMLLAARTEGMIVDPVYTAKILAAVVDFSRTEKDQMSLFIHSGGTPGIFGYAQNMRELVGIETE